MERKWHHTLVLPPRRIFDKAHLRKKKSYPLISMGRYRTMYDVGIKRSNPMYNFVTYFYDADKGCY